MADHDEIRKVMNHAFHSEGCSCGLQRRLDSFRGGLNTEEWTPILKDLFQRIDDLESALDEVGHALVSIIGEDSNCWGRKHLRMGTDVLLDLAAETYENARRQE